jgi:aerobic-type carbon monoxide dehydrogenase small subunit (CoxS/CutS family)
MADLHLVGINVNGRDHELVVESRRTLADVLRHDLGYPGTHLGCEHGICGACTVLLDGAAVRACLVFGVQADGCRVETVEGLADGERLNRLQEAFSRNHALQCGFCTPGFLMLATGFLREVPDPTDEQIREAMASNLCRCTGYQTILAAVREAARGEAEAAAGQPPGEGERARAAPDPDEPLRAHEALHAGSDAERDDRA